MNYLGTTKLSFLKILIMCLLIEGCNNDNEEVKELPNIIDIESVIDLDLDLDFNNDGVPDITYEYHETEYYEFIDRNFDTKVDQVRKYKLDNNIISDRFDEDLDGILETFTEYNIGSPLKTKVDTNQDGVYDIIFVYKNGTFLFGEKYYKKGVKAKTAQIGKVYFKFGYPSTKEQFENTEMTESEFEKSRE